MFTFFIFDNVLEIIVYSPFIMECLKELYESYDEISLRWNGADLLSRVRIKFLHEENRFKNQMELNLHPYSGFFPISHKNITRYVCAYLLYLFILHAVWYLFFGFGLWNRYFRAPTPDVERDDEDGLYRNIVNESFAFHLWNSITHSFVPEPKSLVARLINQQCIHCSDVLENLESRIIYVDGNDEQKLKVGLGCKLEMKKIYIGKS